MCGFVKYTLLAEVCMLWLQVHELIILNINPSSTAEMIEICRWTVSVVYGTTANVAGAEIQNFRIDLSLSNRIGDAGFKSSQVLILLFLKTNDMGE